MSTEQVPAAEYGLTLTPVPLMQLATAFWAFKSLAAAVELDIFSRLSGSMGTTINELAQALSIQERPSEMLLTGCAALGLLEKVGDRYQNTPLAEAFLVQGKPYYFGGFVQMQDKMNYAPWGRLVEAICTNRPTAYDPDKQLSFSDQADPLVREGFWAAMHSLSMFTARVLSEVVDFGSFTRLLDVGGGSGAFDIELCRRYPHLRATVYDLPFVAQIAAEKVIAAGLEDRVATVGGDVFTDVALPESHDVILLSNVLHSFSQERDHEILRKCYQALPSGGAILISELLVNDDKTGPAPAALMSLTMLVGAEPGARNYTGAEYRSWLLSLGFREIQVRPLEAPGANGVVIAYKP